MKWFKHMTDMSEDPKVKRLVRKHGGMGYAVYNYALERIAKRLETESPNPDLEESAEDIADFLHYDTVKVEEIMLTCINEGLFEQDEVTGRILCRKAYKFIEKSQTRSEEMRKMISAYAGLSDTVSDNHGQSETILIEQNRTESRTEQKGKRHKVNHEETGIPMCLTTYNKYIDTYSKQAFERYARKIQAWHDSKGKKYPADLAAAVLKWTYKDEEEGKGPQKRQQETKPKIDVHSLGGGYD